MRGVLFQGDRRAVVESFPDPQPGPRQVVVRMRVAAVCGSDLHNYRASAESLAARGQNRIIPGPAATSSPSGRTFGAFGSATASSSTTTSAAATASTA